MTKQAKILKVISDIILPEPAVRTYITRNIADELAKEIAFKLDEEGVVIKVDRKLPKCLFYDEQMFMLIDCPLYNAGYVTVVPLIKRQK